MPWVMFVHGVVHEGQTISAYLAEVDVDAAGGRGWARFTRDLDDALVFRTYEALIDTWKQQSVVKPLREDGRPNRPLSAYTIEPRQIADG